MKKIFGELNLTWKKLIIVAIILGIYTGIMAALPITKDTSFEDISISFECWILFGIIIIMNSKSAKESALKCLVFFLISQPLAYLVQVPFNVYGWGIFRYYPPWFIWTLFTIPMGFIGFYMKKDKWWGLLILCPMLVFLSYHLLGFFSETISFFPNHLLSTIFCIVTMIIYPLCIFNNKKVKITGLVISIILIAIVLILVLLNGKSSYNTTLFASGYLLKSTNTNLEFDDTYKVYLKDKDYGKLYIEYDERLEDYMLKAEFSKTGKTEFTIESPDGEKYVFDIDIKRDTYHIEEKKEK